jgi:uncharacterized flavoprotein (TIGR03862 family)
VTVTFTNSAGQSIRQRGEFIVTETGVEGSLIYAFSAPIRDEILAKGEASIVIDLAPDWEHKKVAKKLAAPRGSRSISSFIKRAIGFEGVKMGLLWEFVPKEKMADPQELARLIKTLPIPLLAPRPIEEAISSAGGVPFEALDEHLMLKAQPGVFCAGEMLDWEAPTGGYLLTASMASGVVAGEGVVRKFKLGV